MIMTIDKIVRRPIPDYTSHTLFEEKPVPVVKVKRKLKQKYECSKLSGNQVYPDRLDELNDVYYSGFEKNSIKVVNGHDYMNSNPRLKGHCGGGAYGKTNLNDSYDNTVYLRASFHTRDGIVSFFFPWKMMPENKPKRSVAVLTEKGVTKSEVDMLVEGLMEIFR